MSDTEGPPPLDDYKEADTSDFMLHEEDDFKQKGLDGVNGEDIFSDVGFGSSDAPKAPAPEIGDSVPTSAPEIKDDVPTSSVAPEIKDIEPEVLKVDEKKEEEPVEEDEPVIIEDKIDISSPAIDDEVVVPVKKEDIAAPNAKQEVSEEVLDVAPAKMKTAAVEPDEVYDIVIQVSDPHKVGDGMMNSYMAYKVRTKTSLNQFKTSETKVDRRFSDFLGLHEKLLAKHRHVGQLVPPAPEKNVVGMTLVKISKTEEEATNIDFVEKRRAALERYMNRLVRHAPIVNDQDLIDFLEQTTLPQATNTRALSGAGVMRFMKNMEGHLNKMTIKMVEEDAWFEEKQQQVESLEIQLKKLHHAFESLVSHRKELANNTAHFAKSAASLGNAEEHTSLSRALAQLSDSFEKLENQHQEQANKDFFHASEIIGDYLRVIEELKEVFMVRVKSWQAWKHAEQAVQRKREQEMKIQASGRTDKLSQVKADINELSDRVEQAKKDFEKLSATIRKQVGQFEKDRIADFQKMVLIFLKNMMKSQEQSMKNWEAFLPEARAIA